MKTTNNLTSLNVSLETLYKAENKQIEITLSDKPYAFNVVLKSCGGIDCKISSFGANLWMRTNKGLNYAKYKTLSTLQSAIVRKLKEVLDSKGNITFSISDTVYTF